MKVSQLGAAGDRVLDALAPDLGGGDPGGVSAVALGGRGGERGGVLGGAGDLDPGDVAGALADEPGAVEDLAQLVAQVGVGGAEHEGGGAGDGLAGVGGAAEAGDRPGADALADVLGGELPCGAIRPLVSSSTEERSLTRSAIAPTACGSEPEGIARQTRSRPASSISEAGRTSSDRAASRPRR